MAAHSSSCRGSSHPGCVLSSHLKGHVKGHIYPQLIKPLHTHMAFIQVLDKYKENLLCGAALASVKVLQSTYIS